jgi:hypothetical protein
MGWIPRARRARSRVRRGVRRLPGRRARRLDDERNGHDGGGVQGARHRVGGRGDRARAHLRRDRLRTDGGRRPPRLRGRAARDLVPRPGAGRGRRHGAHEGDPARASRSPDGRHGSHHGDRSPPRARGDRGLRPRSRAAVAGSGGRLHRGSRVVQPPVLEDPHLGRRWHAPHERRDAGTARALHHRLWTGEGSGREGVHLRCELPAQRAERRPVGRGDGAVPGPAGRARRVGQGLRGHGGPDPGRARDAA